MGSPDAAFWPDGPLAGPAGLLLRPLGEADIPALVAVTDHPSTLASVSFLEVPFTAAQARALLDRHAGGRDVWFGAFDEGRLAGVVGCHQSGEAGDEIEIGYWLAPEARGRGLARLAAACVRDWVRRVRPGHAITAECRPENQASWRVLTGIGFVPTGEAGRREGRERLVFRA
jgi:RimJ/RimL family protein N-acetyltransferase